MSSFSCFFFFMLDTVRHNYVWNTVGVETPARQPKTENKNVFWEALLTGIVNYTSCCHFLVRAHQADVLAKHVFHRTRHNRSGSSTVWPQAWAPTRATVILNANENLIQQSCCCCCWHFLIRNFRDTYNHPFTVRSWEVSVSQISDCVLIGYLHRLSHLFTPTEPLIDCWLGVFSLNSERLWVWTYHSLLTSLLLMQWNTARSLYISGFKFVVSSFIYNTCI